MRDGRKTWMRVAFSSRQLVIKPPLRKALCQECVELRLSVPGLCRGVPGKGSITARDALNIGGLRVPADVGEQRHLFGGIKSHTENTRL
jgi:hypothetical protein